MFRAALLAAAVLAGALAADRGVAGGCTGAITSATYEGPTGRYPHGVLGDDLEWERLRVSCESPGAALVATLPVELVFEDIAPRLADLDGDGNPEVIVVESHQDRGARLAVWGKMPEGFGRIASTPFIGTRFRWLAPIGVADLDGDGSVEIAYVDRPHLARVLRVWRFADGQLTEIASAPGFTNHRIGDTDIAGGIRDCGAGPEMVLATAGWDRVVAVRLQESGLSAREIGSHEGPKSFAAALACR